MKKGKVKIGNRRYKYHVLYRCSKQKSVGADLYLLSS